MMNTQALLEKFKEQLQNPKRRIQYFLISLVFIYIFWVFLFINPQRATKSELINKIQSLQSQLADTKQRMDTLNKIVKTPAISKILIEKKQLEAKIKPIDQALSASRFIYLSMDDWMKLKKEIIHQQEDMDKNITLVRIIDQPVVAWVPPVIEKSDAAKIISETVDQHELEMKFQADYFSTITYLSRLEKLPWKVYWDSLTYKVLTYPLAEVTIKFHVFTHEKSEA